MKVEQINSRKAASNSSHVFETVVDAVKFLTGVALTCWIPIIVASLATNHAALFTGMVITEFIGTLAGILIYQKWSANSFCWLQLNPSSNLKKRKELELKQAA